MTVPLPDLMYSQLLGYLREYLLPLLSKLSQLSCGGGAVGDELWAVWFMSIPAPVELTLIFKIFHPPFSHIKRYSIGVFAPSFAVNVPLTNPKLFSMLRMLKNVLSLLFKEGYWFKNLLKSPREVAFWKSFEV